MSTNWWVGGGGVGLQCLRGGGAVGGVHDARDERVRTAAGRGGGLRAAPPPTPAGTSRSLHWRRTRAAGGWLVTGPRARRAARRCLSQRLWSTHTPLAGFQRSTGTCVFPSCIHSHPNPAAQTRSGFSTPTSPPHPCPGERAPGAGAPGGRGPELAAGRMDGRVDGCSWALAARLPARPLAVVLSAQLCPLLSTGLQGHHGRCRAAGGLQGCGAAASTRASPPPSTAGSCAAGPHMASMHPHTAGHAHLVGRHLEQPLLWRGHYRRQGGLRSQVIAWAPLAGWAGRACRRAVQGCRLWSGLGGGAALKLPCLCWGGPPGADSAGPGGAAARAHGGWVGGWATGRCPAI